MPIFIADMIEILKNNYNNLTGNSRICQAEIKSFSREK